MNTSALKSFAPAVRRQLMDAVERKLDYVLTADTPDLRQAANQVEHLRKEAARDRKGLIDRVAYTWFNRLAALRFLDARDWHPFRARVITAATPEELQPEILKLLRTGSLPEELQSHTDLKRLNDLLDGRLPTAIAGADPQGEAYRELVLTACRFYHATMPFLFERIDDESELLLPDDLLTANSVIEGFRTEISDEDCSEVEIVGWLYQFYISEKKDTVMARKSAVPTEDIPAVTQLFTPHWIVRYLVENSLGRLWMLNHPTSKLREQMPYYIEGEAETDFLKIGKPEEIKLVDPAVGSGHMLTYAFDLLVKIYEEEGYAPSEIPEKILTHNLYGLEICPRAAQLAQFALVCKAREISRTAFRSPIQPQVICLQDITFEENELKEYIDALKLGSLFSQPVLKLMHQFEQATTFGSLIQPCVDEKAITELRGQIEGKELGSQLFLRETHRKVMKVVKQAEALNRRYHVVLANPPYLGVRAQNSSVKEFLNKYYIDYKSDLFASFIVQCSNLNIKNGYASLVSPNVWLYITTHNELRNHVILSKTLISLVELPLTGFTGATVQLCSYIIKNSIPNSSREATYIRLCDFKSVEEMSPRAIEAIKNEKCKWRFIVKSSEFSKIPGKPIAYWLAKKVFDIFEQSKCIGDYVSCKDGLTSGNNDLFVRRWTEISIYAIHFESKKTINGVGAKWYPYSKGGEFRKFFGNNEYVLNWENNGKEIRGYEKSVVRNSQFYLRSGVTWTLLSSSYFGSRLVDPGYVFDTNGKMLFSESKYGNNIFLGLILSSVGNKMLSVLNPTLAFQVGDIIRIPFLDKEIDIISKSVDDVISKAIMIAKSDWNSFETSWDFEIAPLLHSQNKQLSISDSWEIWAKHCAESIAKMQKLETENNRLFIEAYGLQEELTPEVPEDQITLARPERRKDVVAYLSYAIGCMMGRYSLEKPGLILADAGDSVQEYLHKIGKPLDQIAFPPDEDGIIPVVEGEWFPDDIVARTREFLRVTYGEATLNENLRFIEESLGKSLEKYFLNDFYKDHISNERAYGYKKRPIYWLFQSPKKGFSALVYLHRYTKDTCNTLLNGYLREYIKKIDAKIAHLEHVSATAESSREKTAAAKEMEKLRKVLKECQDWERDVLLPLAQRRLEIDLDDGVKVNYLKFGNALATIPGLASKDEE